MANSGGTRVTPASLRSWILVASSVLIVAIAAFLFYGRWQARRQGFDLPDRLSKTIQQSTAGFTYSESRGGHTIYTLHAAKAVQYKGGGHAELQDVSITLYSAQGAPSNRIYGKAFDWDPVHGVARALGEVEIDFQQAADATQPGAGPPATGKSPEEDGPGRGAVHIKTSGLVFNKQTGLASTPEKLEFRLADAAGSATGASFDSQSGVVVLLADVAFNSSAGGNPLTVHAHHAQYDRDNRLLYLLQDVTDYGDTHGSSDQATVSFRPDGSAFAVEAEGKVVLAASDGQGVHTRKMHIDLGPQSEPQQAVVDGGVLYVADSPNRLLHGSASSATMSFGPQTTIRHAQLRDAVSLVDEEKFPTRSETPKGKEDKPESTTRQLGATKVDIDFATMAAHAEDRTPRPQHILAVGAARINVHELYFKRPPQDTTVQGDQLFATLSDGQALQSLRATGHTSMVLVSPSGAKQSSTGDSLLLNFAAAGGGAGKKSDAAAQATPAARLQTALQSGNVTLTQEAAAGTKTAAATTATADRAEYDATTEMVHLSGSPRIKEPNGELDAAAIEVARLTGNADATGGVKATYRQASGHPSLTFAGKGPVHVVADHAHLDHAKDLTTFYGTAGEQARLWQESDSVAAPVLELSRTQATLSAHGNNGEATAVHAVFTSAPHTTKGALPGRAAGPSVVRLQSKTLVYAENDHKATFNGGVTAQTPNGVLHAGAMDIYLSPAAAGQQPAADLNSKDAKTNAAGQPAGQGGSEVSRIVARSGVVLQQSGRKGTGEELNYTAQDGKFVLTGTSEAPPHMTDDARGAVTGASLIFNDRDDSVIVDGGPFRAATQTHVAR